MNLLLMAIDKKELSKLSPEERIKKLKLMEESRKKEVNEIERLIKESMQELKIGRIAEEVAPGQRAVDISRLFETGSEQNIERTAKQAPLTKDTKGYQAIAQTYEVYTQLQRLNKSLSMYGTLSTEEKSLVGEIGERLNRAERYMTESEKAASKLDAGRAVLYKLRKETGLD